MANTLTKLEESLILLTVSLETEAEKAMSRKDFVTADRLYVTLIKAHEALPLLSSARWIRQYMEHRDFIHDQMQEAQYKF